MTGMGWVIGALITVLAVALVIAGATGHAQNLLPAITGKGTSSSTAATQTSTQAIDAELISLNGSTPAATSSPSTTAPSASPYSGLSTIVGAGGGVVV